MSTAFKTQTRTACGWRGLLSRRDLCRFCTESVPPCIDSVPTLYRPYTESVRTLDTDSIPTLYRLRTDPYTDSVPTLNCFCSVSVPITVEDFLTESPNVVFFFPKCPLVALDN